MSKPSIPDLKVTPTQDLMLSYLVRAYRLGDTLVDIDNAFKKAAADLAEQGIIRTMHGVTNGVFRASLTDDGIGYYMSEKYAPPVFDKNRWSKAKRKDWPKKVKRDVTAARHRLASRLEAEAKAQREAEDQSRAAAE